MLVGQEKLDAEMIILKGELDSLLTSGGDTAPVGSGTGSESEAVTS